MTSSSSFCILHTGVLFLPVILMKHFEKRISNAVSFKASVIIFFAISISLDFNSVGGIFFRILLGMHLCFYSHPANRDAASRSRGIAMPARDMRIDSAVRYFKIISLVSITAFLFIRYKYHKALFHFYVPRVKFLLHAIILSMVVVRRLYMYTSV